MEKLKNLLKNNWNEEYNNYDCYYRDIPEGLTILQKKCSKTLKKLNIPYIVAFYGFVGSGSWGKKDECLVVTTEDYLIFKSYREKTKEKRELEKLKRIERCKKEDENFIISFAEEIKKRYPDITEAESMEISKHACERGSGRVGRVVNEEVDSVGLAVNAWRRHTRTNYDELLSGGLSQEDARFNMEKVY